MLLTSVANSSTIRPSTEPGGDALVALVDPASVVKTVDSVEEEPGDLEEEPSVEWTGDVDCVAEDDEVVDAIVEDEEAADVELILDVVSWLVDLSTWPPAAAAVLEEEKVEEEPVVWTRAASVVLAVLLVSPSVDVASVLGTLSGWPDIPPVLPVVE